MIGIFMVIKKVREKLFLFLLQLITSHMKTSHFNTGPLSHALWNKDWKHTVLWT